VRRKLFLHIGGFNLSYSRPGELGIGFDAELTGRVIASGEHAALVCPSRKTFFRNGCGGKATTATRDKMRRRFLATLNNERMFTMQFQADEPQLLERVRSAQISLCFWQTRLFNVRSHAYFRAAASALPAKALTNSARPFIRWITCAGIARIRRRTSRRTSPR
jgi:hypothetical protein